MRRKCCKDVTPFEPWPLSGGMPPWWVCKDPSVHCGANMPGCSCGNGFHAYYACIEKKGHGGLHVGMSRTHHTVSWDGAAAHSTPEYA